LRRPYAEGSGPQPGSDGAGQAPAGRALAGEGGKTLPQRGILRGERRTKAAMHCSCAHWRLALAGAAH